MFEGTIPLYFSFSDYWSSPCIFLSSIIQVGRVWEHRPPPFSFSIHLSWPCLGASSPSIFPAPIIKVTCVWEHLPLLFSFSNHLTGLCLGALFPSFFFLHLFNWAMFGSTLSLWLEWLSPIFFSFFNYSSGCVWGPCVGASSSSIFLAPIIEVGRVWEHHPSLFSSPFIQMGRAWEHPLPLFSFPICSSGPYLGAPPPHIYFFIYASGPYLGAPPPHIFLSLIIQKVMFEGTIPLYFSFSDYWGSPLYFFLQLFRWVVFGSTVPLLFSFSVHLSWPCLGASSPSIFPAPIIKVSCVREDHPPLFSFSIYSNRSCLGAPPPLVFFLNSFNWAVFGSTVPLLCLSPFIQVARIWEHLPPIFFFL